MLYANVSPVTRLRVTWTDVQGLSSAWPLSVISQAHGQQEMFSTFVWIPEQIKILESGKSHYNDQR
jgi:hypothetical protein